MTRQPAAQQNSAITHVQLKGIFRPVLLGVLHQCYSFALCSFILPFLLQLGLYTLAAAFSFCDRCLPFSYTDLPQRSRWCFPGPLCRWLSTTLTIISDTAPPAGILKQVNKDVRLGFILKVMQQQLQPSIEPFYSCVICGPRRHRRLHMLPPSSHKAQAWARLSSRFFSLSAGVHLSIQSSNQTRLCSLRHMRIFAALVPCPGSGILRLAQ